MSWKRKQKGILTEWRSFGKKLEITEEMKITANDKTITELDPVTGIFLFSK
jgi:hypothetical protein